MKKSFSTRDTSSDLDGWTVVCRAGVVHNLLGLQIVGPERETARSSRLAKIIVTRILDD